MDVLHRDSVWLFLVEFFNEDFGCFMVVVVAVVGVGGVTRVVRVVELIGLLSSLPSTLSLVVFFF